MTGETPYVPPGAEDEDEDVLGKLDGLINKHRSRPSESLPVLTDALEQPEAPAAPAIPTLTDVVSAPALRPLPDEASASLESLLVQRLSAGMDAEYRRLLVDAGIDPVRTQALQELMTSFKRSLPEMVRAALGRSPSGS